MSRVIRTIAVILVVIGIVYAMWRASSENNPSFPVWPAPLRIGYAVEPPFAYPAADGSAAGESPAVARLVLARAGIDRVRWFVIDFSQLIPELLAGRIDMIAAGMFITPERREKIAFSLPTAQVGPGLLTPKDNPRGLTGYADAARDPEVRIAVVEGAVERDELLWLGMSPSRLFSVPDARSGMEAVRQGRADGLALSGPSVALLARQASAEFEAIVPGRDEAAGPERWLCAFGFRQTDAALMEAVNVQLARFLGTDEHLALIAPFGFGQDSLPPRLAPEAAPSGL